MKSEVIVLSCRDLGPALDFYTRELGFRIDLIFPADAPRVARLSGHGIDIRLECDSDAGYAGARQSLPPFEPALVVHRAAADGWGTGRAGMQYRDLVPNRLGGHYIASHIRIPDGGPVPDYVHHHDVRFQMIYSYKGWVKVVYEDQGPPFVMQAGDCVLQPPHIRHRVLECSEQMEVIEITSPAEHETLVDHDMTLPTSELHPGRDFKGQRFVYHRAERAAWQPGPAAGFESRELGIERATGRLASARVVRPTGQSPTTAFSHDGEFFFNFVLQGTATLRGQDRQSWTLTAGDTFVLPPRQEFSLTDFAAQLELLQVTTRAK